MNRKRLMGALSGVVLLAAACAPTDGHPLRSAPNQWPQVVVEDHTDSVWPVNGAFGPGWGIQGAIRGRCASYPTRLCYVFGQGQTSTNGAYTTWTYGNVDGKKFRCTTTLDVDQRGRTLAIRTELVRHEIGHCYGLAHAAQGAGTMEPTVTGRFANPTADERATLARLYVP